VFTLIGGLLLFTALAKLWMLATDSFADVRVGISKEILWFSVLLEFGLAYLNFRVKDVNADSTEGNKQAIRDSMSTADRCGQDSPGSPRSVILRLLRLFPAVSAVSLKFINTVVFASFGIFAAIRWGLGYGSCGCSGSLELPAWFFILIDGVIVAWFIRTQAARDQVVAGFNQLVSRWNGWSPAHRGRWVGGATFVAMIFAMQLPIAAPLRGKVFGIDTLQAMVKIDGELIMDQEQSGQVELLNHSFQPAKIIGISRSCRCFDISQDPISQMIPANGRLVLPLVIKPNKLGPLHQRVELYVDHPNMFRVNVNVVSSVQVE